MADFGTSPTSVTALGANEFPVSSVYVPNTAGQKLTATRGGRPSTDSSNKQSAAAEVFTADLAGASTSISVATPFSGVPSVSQLLPNSYAELINPGGMATFLAELQTSAFVGTLSFYGLEPDGSKLQLISAHQRGTSTFANSIALSVASATNEVWTGSIAGFSAIYVVCTAFTSGSITVTPALSAGVYAVSITNTVNTQDTNSAAMKADLDTLAAIVSSSKARVLAGAGDITDLATLSGIVSSGKAAVKAASSDIVDLATLLTKFTAALDGSGFIQTHQKLGGSDLADTNAMPTITDIQQMILNGKAYSCSTGLVTAAANMAASFFVPNTSAKNVLIWSVRVMYSNASQISDFRSLTADDTSITAGTSDAGNVLNLKAGGPASSSGFAMHHASGVTAPAVSAASLPLDEVLNQVNANAELLSPGMFILIPAGTAAGIAVYTGTTASGKWAVVVRFVEY